MLIPKFNFFHSNESNQNKTKNYGKSKLNLQQQHKQLFWLFLPSVCCWLLFAAFRWETLTYCTILGSLSYKISAGCSINSFTFILFLAETSKNFTALISFANFSPSLIVINKSEYSGNSCLSSHFVAENVEIMINLC